MLGHILGALTDTAAGEATLAAIAEPALVARVREAAAAEGVRVDAFLSATVRQMLDHAEEDMWLDLLGRMSRAPNPGVIALHALLARAFPDPAAVTHRR